MQIYKLYNLLDTIYLQYLSCSFIAFNWYYYTALLNN